MKLNLGNQIRSNRRRMDLTQEQLADEFGTSPQAISRWENGTTYPDIEMLPMIASFFGTSVDALLGCTDQEKEKFCNGIQNELTTAAKDKDAEKTVELLREIRRNLREYHHGYWLWGLFNELWKSRLYTNKKVLDEMRMLAEEIFAVYPKEDHGCVIESMANMEDDEHIEAFLKDYASIHDLRRQRLLYYRYKGRGELDKAEQMRHFILWNGLNDLLTVPAVWLDNRSSFSPENLRWFCETQLNYLNAVNCLTPDKKHIVSGGAGMDLWCEPRVILGLSYAKSLAKLGETEASLDAFEDTVGVIEQVMNITDDEFELACSSPALKGFSLKCAFYWISGGYDGKEYRNLQLESNGWNEWICPQDILRSINNDSWYGPISISCERFDSLKARLKKCIIEREAKE